MTENDIGKFLKELLEETKLLTVHAKAEAIRKFNADFLTSDLRRQMYEAFDGVRTFQQISTDSLATDTLRFIARLQSRYNKPNYKITAPVFPSAL